MNIPAPGGMPADKVLAVLQKSGVTSLFHVNTVRTSIAFFKSGGLLSRDRGEKLGQTSQYTDEQDKQLGVWDKVFVDTLDIHTRLKRRNLYGPVMLVFDPAVLQSNAVDEIRVSVKNPANWKDGDKTHDRWFTDPKDLLSRFKQSCAWENSLVLSCKDGLLPFAPYLKKVILDEPHQNMPGTENDTFAFVKKQLIASMGQLRVPVEWQACSYWYKCPGDYKSMVKSFPEVFKRLFSP